MSDQAKCTWEAARVNAGLTINEAADRIGISHATLINYEKYRTMPQTDIALKMCDVYGKSIEFIFLQKRDN